MYDTGKNAWSTFENWPPLNAQKKTYRLHNGSLAEIATMDWRYEEFVSDPSKPVPYTEDIKTVFTPRKYMTDDQRFAARRPDVLVFETEVLENDVTLAGEIMARLKVSTTGTDADWIVKVIDVFPANTPDTPETQNHLK